MRSEIVGREGWNREESVSDRWQREEADSGRWIREESVSERWVREESVPEKTIGDHDWTRVALQTALLLSGVAGLVLIAFHIQCWIGTLQKRFCDADDPLFAVHFDIQFASSEVGIIPTWMAEDFEVFFRNIKEFISYDWMNVGSGRILVRVLLKTEDAAVRARHMVTTTVGASGYLTKAAGAGPKISGSSVGKLIP
jgi:hypothetical protein